MMSADAPGDPLYTHMRDAHTGQIIVCGQCPAGDLRSAHWTTVNGRPVCLCELATSPAATSEAQNQPSGSLLGSQAAN